MQQLDLFLAPQKRKKIREEVHGLMEELRKLSYEILREELPTYLGSIKSEIESCQEILSHVLSEKIAANEFSGSLGH